MQKGSEKRPARRPPPSPEPRIRRGTVRVSGEVAMHLRAGHPYVFREALGPRPLRENAGELIEIVDPDGTFIARGLYDPEGIVALRMFSRDREERIELASMRQRVLSASKLRNEL